jgi:hypothetical protein
MSRTNLWAEDSTRPFYEIVPHARVVSVEEWYSCCTQNEFYVFDAGEF